MPEQDDQVNKPEEQYQAQDSGPSYEPPASEEPSGQPPHRPDFHAYVQIITDYLAEHRRLTVFIVFIIAITIVYQFIGGGSKKQPMQLAKNQAAATVQPALQGATALSDLKRSRDEMKKKVDDVQQLLMSNKYKTDDMAQRMQLMRLQVLQLEADQKHMIAVMTALTKEVKKLEPKQKGFKTAPLTYFIQAIVPGRAWLSSNQGDYMTVQVGSELRGAYGTVRRIDANAGLIQTSTGKMVHFSPTN